jgi:hypothetical protein
MPIHPKINTLNPVTDYKREVPSRHAREHSVDAGRPKSKLTLNTGRQSIPPEVIASRVSNASRSPDKYVIGNSLVVSLNESTISTNNNKNMNNTQTQFYKP